MNVSVPKITINIHLMPDGTVQVNGPITDRILCYEMLEAARDAIHDYKVPDGPQIALASAMPPFKLKVN